MSPDKMVYMANQIASFFNSQPEDNHPERIAGHIKDFWDPRMRAQLIDFTHNGGEGLNENVLKAVAIIDRAA